MTTSRKSVSETSDTPSRIHLKVLGVGGAGGNAVAHIANEIAGSPAHPLVGVELVAINTDRQALLAINRAEKLSIGSSVTHGLGTGGDVELGLRAAQQDTEQIEAVVHNTDLVFVVAGLGGGTGTGAAPIVARVAKEQGAMVLAFVMLPFAFEGERRRQQALTGLEQLKLHADAVVCVPNDKLFKIAGDSATALDAFKHANELLVTGVGAFWQLLSRKGLINVDFAAVRNALGTKHADGIFSTGTASGANRAKDAIKAVFEHPLLDGPETLGKAEAVLVSVLGGPDLSLTDVQRAIEPITRAASRGQVIMGAAIDESYTDRITITVVATANLLPRRVAHQPVSPRQIVGRRTALADTAPRPLGQPVTPPAPAASPAAGKKDAPPKQESLPLDNVSRGRFDKSEPTLYDGEDLDVPTFLRRGVSLKK